MRLVLDTKDDFGVVNESSSELGPEFSELFGGGRSWVRTVPDNLYDAAKSIIGRCFSNVTRELTLPLKGWEEGSLYTGLVS